MRARSVLAAAGVLASVAIAHAQNDPDEKAKRHAVVPFIKALTYCIADVAMNDENALGYYRNGGFDSYLYRQLQKCPLKFQTLLERYDDVYGDGEAERFIKGPYASDLQRAVLSVIKPQLDAKVTELQMAEAAERSRRYAEAAEEQRRETDRQAELARAEAERKAIESKAAMEKRERVDVAKRAMGVLRDKFYDCVDHQLVGLVRSGETADVLANVSMTICGRQLGDLQDSAVEEMAAENGGSIGTLAEDTGRAQIKAVVKERVVADAVQAKAGVGMFANDAVMPGKF